LIDRYRLQGNIIYLGPLTAKGLCDELSHAQVSVVPSLVENGSNSLAEAMLAGTPSVAALAGGMTTTVSNGETALCFPLGDSAVLAECIRTLFVDQALAKRLARNAREVALIRHDKERIVTRIFKIYDAVINGPASTEINNSLSTQCF
jgi:glycosyltransferase involved in cell wall biosynthesis